MSTPSSVRIDDLAAPRLPDDIVALRESVREMAAGLPFDLAALEAQARAETGLDDFGDDLYVEPFTVCLRALAAEGGLGPLGRLSSHGLFAQLLRNRLLIVDYLKQYPDANEIEIERPIIICGLPRTGTTHLHNLMSADTNLRSLPYWESLEPVPPLAEQGQAFDVDPRWTRCDSMLSMQDHVVPYMRRMHDMYPDHVHEEIQLLAIDFATMLFETQALMPSYRDWFLGADQTPHYRYLKRVLQVLTHLRGGERWVLKSPQHLAEFAALRAVFPDATVVVTHRDPVEVVTSMLTMLAYSGRLMVDRPDPAAIAAYWVPRLEDLLLGCVRDRELLPADRSVDVGFTSFMADDLAAVADIYELAGQPLDERARSAQAAYLAGHRRNRFGRVRYDLEPFGVTADELRARFAPYRERFPDC